MTNLDGYELFWLEKWIKANDIGNYREAFNLFKKHSDSFFTWVYHFNGGFY